MQETSDWMLAAAVQDVPQEDVVAVQVAGVEVALYQVGQQIYATANACTHGEARLCDGFLDGHEIECPLHQGRFDVRDGRATCAPASEALRCFPVKVEDGKVYLRLVAGKEW